MANTSLRVFSVIANEVWQSRRKEPYSFPMYQIGFAEPLLRSFTTEKELVLRASVAAVIPKISGLLCNNDWPDTNRHSVTPNCHCFIPKVRFLTPRVHFLTLRDRFSTPKVDFLILKVRFSTSRVRFFTSKVNFSILILQFFNRSAYFPALSFHFPIHILHFFSLSSTFCTSIRLNNSSNGVLLSQIAASRQ